MASEVTRGLRGPTCAYRATGNDVRIWLTVVRGDFRGDPAISDPISYDVELSGDATREQLEELIEHVDAIAEIPNSVRNGTAVELGGVAVTSTCA